MAENKEGDVLTTPLLKKREDVEMSSVNSMPSIAIVPSRPSKTHHHLMERETSENSSVSLHQAARDGKIDLVKRRLEQLGKGHKKINQQDTYNTTPLHYAVRYNHVEVVKLLLEYGADIEAKGEDEATPLHYAARFCFAAKHSSRGTPRTSRRTKDALPKPSASTNDLVGITLKKDEKEECGSSSSLSKATGKERLFGNFTKKRESLLGSRLFKDFQIGEKKTTNVKDNSAVNSTQKNGSQDTMIGFLISQKAKVNAKDSYGSTPLHYAVAKKNIEAVKELLKQPSIDIEAKDKTKMTPLHAAASHGTVVVTKCLIEASANLRSLDEEQMTPLHFACVEGHLDIAKLLFEAAELEGGWSTVSKMVTDQDREEETPLHLAVEGRNPELAKLCLDKGANVNAVKMNMSTALHLAATDGDRAIVRMLIQHDANVEAKNALQETPLHRAALFNRTDVIEDLLKHGACIECRDKDKDTPLLIAAGKNHIDAMKLLLENGADLGAKDVNDCTPLFKAASEGCIEAIQLLLKEPKGKSLVEECDKYENTPLHIAARKGYVRIIALLFKYEACIDSKNDEGATPLHLAAKYGKIRSVCALLNRDPSIINDEDDGSNTPLHLAALYGHSTVVKELLDRGAAVDARNATLWTPLDCAAARGCVEVATVLLQHDCPVDPTDKSKTTPLHLASREGHVEMVKLLMSHKAKINLKDSAGKNCLDIAIENNHKEVVQTIINHADWKKAMKNRYQDGKNVTSPMRKLIKKLPEVAGYVFNRCVTSNGHPVDNPKYAITLDYEFLDDVNLDWAAGSSESQDDQDEDHGLDAVMEKIKSALPENATKQTQLKANHPLMLMVNKERVKLLSHPLVTYLLRYKWKKFGRYVYYSKLILYCIFLFFLTGYALVTTKSMPTFKCVNATFCACQVNFGEIKTGSDVVWRMIGRPLVILTACISLLLEFLNFCYVWRLYLQWHRLIEVSAYVVSLIYVIDEITVDGTTINVPNGSRCFVWHNSVGAAAVYLSWTNLVLFMRKFPKLGIYVVMFTHIFKTFARFFVVFFLFIVGFGLAFHILIYEQVPFATPGRSMLKTTMGMLGEFEYDTVYNENEVPPIAWPLYVCFLVINCIIIMNLLVGLAVDDIKGVQEKSALKRLAMQVDLVLDVEKALPAMLRRRFVSTEEVVYPNENKYWTIWSFWNTGNTSPARIINDAMNPEKTPIEKLQRQQDQLKEDVTNLNIKLKSVLQHTTHLEMMMKAMMKHHGVSVEEEQEGEDDE
ncbi:transient receptor potential cation channel subfamily A member 1 homolog [Actinia tenebrosa]|uniref:Transient receptor potential cation channel subfamily A member 1 homolog n=1 Tax=Actinia tenebrosa TaxID=6105 RepID=A0A6P8I162_ACTTE|nr:transient receptor potential cation channel subfamily A member 1 homolog [Actinia tenebrosa]